MQKLLASSILVLVLFLGPWWLALSLAGVFAVVFERPWQALVCAIILDYLSAPVILGGIDFIPIATLIVLALAWSALPIKRQLRYYDTHSA